jgi:transcriptional regulator with XRE-family HTH domain
MAESLNNRIKYAMLQSGIQQKDLAERMGFELPKGQARISQQLRGADTDSIKLVEAVAKLTGANLLWLITGHGIEFEVRKPGSFSGATEIPDDPEEYVSTRMRAVEESIKKLQDKQDEFNDLARSMMKKALREDQPQDK